jgi:lysophospholipid acyltransferase (LPLAT)-like uncharacterized protein
VNEKNKEKKPFKYHLIMFLIPVAALIIRIIGFTMRIRIIDPAGVAPQAQNTEKYIYSFWHNQLIVLIYTFRNLGVSVLVSRSRDGDYITRVNDLFGFGSLRSSTSSGKVTALRGLVRKLRSGGHVTITPDGPRGPVYKAQPGAVFLGALSGNAVVPFASFVDRTWKLRTWDRFEIPKPFSQAVIVLGERISIPKKLTDAQSVELTLLVENKINACRERAMTLVAEKTKK